MKVTKNKKKANSIRKHATMYFDLWQESIRGFFEYVYILMCLRRGNCIVACVVYDTQYRQ